MTVPNFISIARLLAVPVLVWALVDGRSGLAFVVFIVAGISDAVDGAIARRFNQQSALGAYLDPIADKALMTAIFVGLGMLGQLPAWLVIAVVSRDLLIMAAVVLSFLMGRPITVRPLLVSKLTTLSQLLLGGFALAEPVFRLPLTHVVDLLIGITALLTAISATAYLLDWLRHMASGEAPVDREGDTL